MALNLKIWFIFVIFVVLINYIIIWKSIKGSYEQKKTLITQNFESIKREISSAIEKLVSDLRDRERCLVAEAEVYMQSQIRTIGLENENAEIEFATVSSFCDSTETTLSRFLWFFLLFLWKLEKKIS